MSPAQHPQGRADSIVTSIAVEYEENGTTIDKIEVISDIEEEDLLWLIAINSVAHQQDLDAKTWAGAMFEVLRDSDALNKYASYFEEYRPSYEGDNSCGGGGGGIEHGSGYGSDIRANWLGRRTADCIGLVKGLAVWESGHIGGYVGNGYVAEAMGTKYGVVRTKVDGRGWQGWCKLPSIMYIEG